MKFVNQCLLYLSNEQLQLWIVEINNKIINNMENKNEKIISEILEYMNIQIDILLKNKNQEIQYINLSEWIINYMKFHNIFKNSNFEWKLYNKFLVVSKIAV